MVVHGIGRERKRGRHDIPQETTRYVWERHATFGDDINLTKFSKFPESSKKYPKMTGDLN